MGFGFNTANYQTAPIWPTESVKKYYKKIVYMWNFEERTGTKNQIQFVYFVEHRLKHPTTSALRDNSFDILFRAHTVILWTSPVCRRLNDTGRTVNCLLVNGSYVTFDKHLASAIEAIDLLQQSVTNCQTSMPWNIESVSSASATVLLRRHAPVWSYIRHEDTCKRKSTWRLLQLITMRN